MRATPSICGYSIGLGAGKKPTLVHVLRGLYAGVEWSEGGLALADCVPEEPVGLLGIYAMKLPAKALGWVRAYAPADNQPDPQKDYFDKLSLRRDFDPMMMSTYCSKGAARSVTGTKTAIPSSG